MTLSKRAAIARRSTSRECPMSVSTLILGRTHTAVPVMAGQRQLRSLTGVFPVGDPAIRG